MKPNKIIFLFLFILSFLTIISIYFYIEFDNKLNKVNENILKNEIVKVSEFAKNISQHILEKTGENIHNTLKRNPLLIKSLEKRLSSFISQQYTYIYLIYKDEDKKFRYLLDGSKDLNNKGEFDQKFDPQRNKIWEKVFTKLKPQVVTQKDIEELWITYLYPLISEGKVVAVLVFDFSIKDYYKILENIKPLKNFFFYLMVFMIFILVTGYFQIYLNYKSRKKSIIDPLTLTYNRTYMNEIIKDIDLEKYQICMLDIDHFKHINDTYGHKIGDKVLEKISSIIKSQIRHEDILIRYGGEEFLLFLYKKERVLKVDIPNRIRKAIKKEVMYIDNHKISITVSFGVNTEPNYSKNIEEAIKIADEQLYIAKKSGRNIVISTTNKQIQSNSSKKILEIKDALEDDRIICFYQPIFDIINNKITKYEVLVRMLDTNGKVILPNKFLPSIKNTTAYIELTKKVLECSIKTIEKYNVNLSINLSTQDFFNEDIINAIKKDLTSKKEIAQKITLEILEQNEITDIKKIEEKIGELKKLGIKIALDNFGSGFANFSYLLHLKIDTIKIDGSLIKEIDKNKNALHVTKAIVAFCKTMKFEIIAKAVENKNILDIVKLLGIKNVQGYYLAKPSCKLLIKNHKNIL